MLRSLAHRSRIANRQLGLLVQAPGIRQHERPRSPLTGWTRSLHRRPVVIRKVDLQSGDGRLLLWDDDGKPPEAFYDRYLSILVKSRPREASVWVNELDLAACQDVLPHDLGPDPLQCFQSAHTELALAGHCLEAFVIGQHRLASCLAEARSNIAASKAGVKGLLWLVKRPDYKQLDLALQPRFLRALIHCLVAEGNASDILTWLHLPVGDDTLSMQSRLARTWKGIALRKVLVSSRFWADNDIRASISACTIATRADRRGTRSEPQSHVPKHPAGS